MERRNKDRRANCARRSSRLLAQKPLLGRLHQNDLRKAKDPYSIQAARVSTDHSGASPVASALGIRLGATPRGRNYTNMHSQTATPKGDILTLLEKGTFSLCLDTPPGRWLPSPGMPRLYSRRRDYGIRRVLRARSPRR